jgi:hypothetical protein
VGREDLELGSALVVGILKEHKVADPQAVGPLEQVFDGLRQGVDALRSRIALPAKAHFHVGGKYGGPLGVRQTQGQRNRL